MVDVHCHLNFKSFSEDYDEIIKRAEKAGVTTIINTGTQISSSTRAVELASEYENLYAIVGVHPHHADKLEDGWIEELEKLTKQPKVVGIGECGMDFYAYASNGIVDPKLQTEAFEAQIELAHRADLPLQIHNRQAGKKVIEILKHHKNSLKTGIPGMFHCFAGNFDFLDAALDLGFYIGFDGNTTYDGLAKEEDTDLKDIARRTPLERIVIETDSPYLPPEPHRRSRNEPSYAIITAEFIAQLKNVSFEDFDLVTTENARAIFQLDARP